MADSQPTVRTFEDIERQARELHAIELEAVETIVNVLRELAVALPPESKLPYDLADTANRLTYEVKRHARSGGSPRVPTSNALHWMNEAIGEEMQRWQPRGDES